MLEGEAKVKVEQPHNNEEGSLWIIWLPEEVTNLLNAEANKEGIDRVRLIRKILSDHVKNKILA